MTLPLLEAAKTARPKGLNCGHLRVAASRLPAEILLLICGENQRLLSPTHAMSGVNDCVGA